MTFAGGLQALLSDEAARRREFPVAADKVYLAHAAVCPLPACVVAAISEYLGRVGRGGQFEYLHAPAELGARTVAAELLGVEAAEIAFVSSTSAGLSLVASGFDWRPGDSVVYAAGDFPSNVYPWQRLAQRGVRPRAIPARPDGAVTLEDVAAQLEPSTRLVALSSVHYATGARTDIDAIGAYLEGRGIELCVDAIQSLGAVPTSAVHADYLVADAHKWLLGPQGMGILVVRRRRFDTLPPPLLGWKSVQSQKDFLQREIALADTARRYEPGSLNALGLVGLHAALALLQRTGIATIAARLAGLRDHLAPALASKGYEVLGPTAPDTASRSIVSFRREGADMEALYRKLDAEGIVTSLRSDPAGRTCIRVAPHFYNTEAELDRLLALL